MLSFLKEMDGRLSGEARAGTFGAYCKGHFTSDLGDFQVRNSEDLDGINVRLKSG